MSDLVSRADIVEELPAIDAVPVDKMVLYDLSINTKTRTAKAVFLFGDKKITLCRDCGELATVVHGRWVSAEAKPRLIYFCSACGEKWGYGSISYMKYCPNCGAKMDLEDDHEP